MQTFTSTRDLPKQVPAFPRVKGLLGDVLARVREDFPKVNGLTHVTADTAIFQVNGDATRYCLSITRAEADALGYMDL
jgi:hypothetical protein